MKSAQRLGVFLAGVSLYIFVAATAQQEIGKPAPKMTRLQGKVIDLNQEIAKLYPIDFPTKGTPLLGLKTESGELYTLLHTQTSVAVFLDPRLHNKSMTLHGRLFPNSNLFEITRYYTVQENVLHELYYWCEVCSIKSLSPELCACCQDPVELVETPVLGAEF